MRIRNLYKKLGVGVKASVVYTLASLLTRGLAIITTPIFTRIMTSAEIGTVTLYNSWYSMISAVATLSLTSGGFQLAMKEFEGRRDQYMSSVLSITSLVAMLIGGVYFGAPGFWQEQLGLSHELIILMLIGFLVAPARDFWMAKQRYEYKYRRVGILSFATGILASALSVFAVVLLNSRGSDKIAEGRLFANYFVIYGVAFIIWLYVFAKGKTFFSKEYWKFSLSISLPLVGYSMARQVLEVSDRAMISRFVGDSEVGIYGLLYSVSSLSLLVWNAINASFVPYLYQNMENKGKEKSIQTMASGLLGTYALVAIAITFFAPEIVRILATEEYYQAIYIAPPIAAGVFLTSVSHMYSNILLFFRKSKAIMIISVTAALTNVILNFIFIPIYGYMAAAYTTLIAYIILAGGEGVIAVRVYRKETNRKMRVYHNGQILLLGVITIIMSMAALLVYNNTILRYTVAVLIGALAVFCVIRVKRGQSVWPL